MIITNRRCGTYPLHFLCKNKSLGLGTIQVGKNRRQYLLVVICFFCFFLFLTDSLFRLNYII